MTGAAPELIWDPQTFKGPIGYMIYNVEKQYVEDKEPCPFSVSKQRERNHH